MFDPVGDALSQYRQPDEDDIGSRVRAALRRAAEAFARRVSENAQRMGEVQSYGMSPGERAMGGSPFAGAEGGNVLPPQDVSNQTPERLMASFRSLASPVQSVGNMGSALMGMAEQTPMVQGGGVSDLLSQFATLPDDVFGSTEEHANAGFPAPARVQFGSDVATEIAGILAGGGITGTAARGLAPRLANAPSFLRAPVQLAASEAPATRLGGIARDFLRYAPVEGALAASDERYSTSAGITQMREFEEMFEQLPDEEKTGFQKALMGIYQNTYGLLPDEAQTFVAENPIGRVLGELPVSLVGSLFGFIDADKMARRPFDMESGADVLRYRGGVERMKEQERNALDPRQWERLNEYAREGRSVPQSLPAPRPFEPARLDRVRAENPDVWRGTPDPRDITDPDAPTISLPGGLQKEEPFYSRLEQVIDKLADPEVQKGTRGRFPNGTTARNWAKALSREPVTSHEIGYRGLTELFEADPERHLTPDELRDHIRGTMPYIGSRGIDEGVEIAHPVNFSTGSGADWTRGAVLSKNLIDRVGDMGLPLDGNVTQRAHNMASYANGFVKEDLHFAPHPTKPDRLILQKAVDDGQGGQTMAAVFDIRVGELTGSPTFRVDDGGTMRRVGPLDFEDFKKKITGALADGTLTSSVHGRKFIRGRNGEVLEGPQLVGANQPARYGKMAHPEARENAAEHVLIQPNARINDHHFALTGGDGATEVSTRMADVTPTLMPGTPPSLRVSGDAAPGRMINEIQATMAQQQQQITKAFLDEAKGYGGTASDFEKLNAARQGLGLPPLKSPDEANYSQFMDEVAPIMGPISGKRLEGGRLTPDEHATLQYFNDARLSTSLLEVDGRHVVARDVERVKRGGGLSGRLDVVPDKTRKRAHDGDPETKIRLESGLAHKYGMTGDEPRAFPESSQFAAAGLRLGIIDAVKRSKPYLWLTNAEMASKYATGVAETLEMVDHADWNPNIGRLTLYETTNAGDLVEVARYHKGADFENLEDIIPGEAGELLKLNGPDEPVPLTLDNMALMRGGMAEYYDKTVVNTMDSELRSLGLNPDRMKVVGQMGDGQRVVGYRITDELRKIVAKDGLKMWGSAGLAAAGLAADDEEGSYLTAMALFGLPGGRQAGRAALKSGVTASQMAAARAGIRASQLWRAFSVSMFPSVGLGIAGGIADTDNPKRGAMVGALLGAAIGTSAAWSSLKRVGLADSPVLRALASDSKPFDIDALISEILQDPKKAAKESFVTAAEAFKAGRFAIRQSWFDELAAFQHLRWNPDLPVRVEKGTQEGPETVGIWDYDVARVEAQRALTSGPVIDEVDLLGEPTMLATRQQNRLTILQEMKDRAHALMKSDPNLAFKEAHLEALDSMLGKRASNVEALERHARLLRGHRGYGEVLMRDGVMAPGEINPRTKRSWQQVIEGLGSKANTDLFNRYAIARRVQHLKMTGREKLIPPQYKAGTPQRADLDAALEEATPAIKKAYDDMQEINREMLKLAEEQGVLAPGAAEKILKSVGNNYTPFFRDIPKKPNRWGFRSGANSTTKGGSPVHAMTGTEDVLAVVDPLESFSRLHFQYSNAIFRQRAANDLAKIVPFLDPTQVRKVQPWEYAEAMTVRAEDFKNLTPSQRKRLRQMLADFTLEDKASELVGRENVDEFIRMAYDELGIQRSEMAGMLPPGQFTIETRKMDPNDRIIRTFDQDGKAEYWKVEDEDLWDAIHGAEPPVYNAAMRIAVAPARWLRTFTTSTPQFQFANLFRDTSFAAVSSDIKDKFYQAYIDAMGGLAVIATASLSPGARMIGPGTVGGLVGGLANINSDDPGLSFAEGFGGGFAIGGSMGALARPAARAYLKGTGVDPKQVMRLFGNVGASQAAFQTMDLKNIGKSIRQTIEDANKAARRKDPISRSVVFMHPIEALRNMGIAVENANRVGEFVRGIKQMQKADGVTLEGLEKTAVGARDVSIDFSRKGAAEIVQYLRPTTAFWGAGMQSTDKLIRMVKTNPKKVAAVGLATITLPSLGLYYINRDNPEYWDLPLWQRVTTWPVPRTAFKGTPWYSEKGFVLLPKPFELGMIFGALPEQILSNLDQEGGLFERMGKGAMNPAPEGESGALDIVGEVLRGTLENLTPMPTGLDPFWENIRNKDFNGLDIVSPWDDARDLEDHMRGYDNASQFGRWLGRIAGWSPAQVDNVIQGYFGTVGRESLHALDVEMRPEQHGERPAVPFEDRFVHRRFMSDVNPVSTPALSKFYEDFRETEALVTNIRNLRSKGLMEESMKLLLDDPRNVERIEQLSYWRDVEQSLSDLRDVRDEVEQDPEISGEIKRSVIDKLNKQINDLAKEAMGWRTTRE